MCEAFLQHAGSYKFLESFYYYFYPVSHVLLYVIKV